MTQVPDFAEAVRRSKNLIENGLKFNSSPSADGEFMMVAMEPHRARLVVGANMIRKNPAQLISWARETAEGFDTAKLGIAYALENNEPIPDEARAWLIKVLKEEILRPKAQAGRKHKEWLEILIWSTIQMRVDEGMSATRNDASDPISACDAIAEAMRELGLTPATFEGVKRIWLRMRKKEFPTFPAT